MIYSIISPFFFNFVISERTEFRLTLTNYGNDMNNIDVVIISKSENLPEMKCNNFFHSSELFRIIEQTPGQSPYMAVARCAGTVVGHMLVMLRRRGSLIPPYLFTQARVYGEGDYAEGVDREEVFGLLLDAVEKKMRRKLCLYTEFSDLETKMFGYAKFRTNGFFPVHWMEIRNSLHSMTPEERLLPRARKHIENAVRAGLQTYSAQTDDDIREVVWMLKGYTTLKIRRYIPDFSMFSRLHKSGHCDIFITREESRIIGGCVCVNYGSNCYMWYLTARSKLHIKRTYAITVWTALQNAYVKGMRHMCFMDVGLPFRRNPLREFILSFGGKPVGTYRWFRCTIGWINSLLSWLYRE